MQTTIKDLIEMIAKVETDSVDKNMLLSVLKFMYLPKEKEQIINAVTYGQNNHSVSTSSDLECANKYYNSNFIDSK